MGKASTQKVQANSGICFRSVPSLIELIVTGTLDYGINGPDGSQKHDGHKNNDVDHICPEVEAVLLWLHHHQPNDTRHPEGHWSEPKGTKESK